MRRICALCYTRQANDLVLGHSFIVERFSRGILEAHVLRRFGAVGQKGRAKLAGI
jgi:hypothetical protein